MTNSNGFKWRHRSKLLSSDIFWFAYSYFQNHFVSLVIICKSISMASLPICGAVIGGALTQHLPKKAKYDICHVMYVYSIGFYMIMFQLIIMSIKNDQHYRSAPLEPYNRVSQHWRVVSFCWRFHQIKSLFREHMWLQYMINPNMYVFKGIEYKPKITGKSQVGDAYMPCSWKY